MNLAERTEATRATLERFAGVPFDFGRCDCGLMTIAHLKRMGWKPKTGHLWKSTNGARKWLKAHGGDFPAFLDSVGLQRIAPAAAIIGDVMQLCGEPPFGAFGIAVGNGRVLAFHEDVEGAAIIQPTGLPIIAAWRA